MKPPEGRDPSEPRPGVRRTPEEVLRRLFALAEADPAIGAAQRPALERYRRALSPRPSITVVPSAPVEAFDLGEIPLADRVDVLRMLLRVAEDGEAALLRQLSGLLGVATEQFEELWQDRAARRRKRRRKRWAAGLVAAALVVVAVAAIVTAVRRSHVPNAEVAALLAEAREQMERIERLRSEPALLARSAEIRTRGQQEIDLLLTPLEQNLQSQMTALQQGGDPSAEEIRRLADALAQTQAQLARILEQLDDPADTFRGYVERYGPSVLLVMVQSFLLRGGDEEEVTGYGTGFFVSEDGVIVTNRHVVRPWEARPDLLEDGYRLDDTRVRIAAWPTGARVYDDRGKPVLDGAYFTGSGTLSLALEGSGSTDLALLRAQVVQPVEPLPLSDDDPATIRVFDAVSVLGYPSGSGILERGDAVMAPSTGSVRKVEEHIFIDASILPGNSGGPVIDLDGNVIAIATKNNVDSSMGICIPSREIVNLLKQLRSAAGL